MWPARSSSITCQRSTCWGASSARTPCTPAPPISPARPFPHPGTPLRTWRPSTLSPDWGTGAWAGWLPACLLDSLEGEAIAGGLGYRVGGTEHVLPSPGYRHRGGHRHAGRDGNQQGRTVPLQRNASAPRRRTWRRTGPGAAAQRSAPFLPRPGVEPLVTGLRVADQQIRAAWDLFAAMGEVRRFAVADVRIMELVITRDESAVLTLRWEATGPGGQAVPGPGRRDHANPRRAARHPAPAGRSLPACAACPWRGTRQADRAPGSGSDDWSFPESRRRCPRPRPGPWPMARQEPGHHGLRGIRQHPQRPSRSFR